MKRAIGKQCFLVSAIAAASGVAGVAAGNIYIEATGVGVNQQTTVQNVPGIANTLNPPIYQEPRLRNYGGDGWASKIRLVIDDATGAVTDYQVTLTDPLGQNYGSGGPQFDIRTVGREYTYPNDFDGTNCEVAPDFIPEAEVNPTGFPFPGTPPLTGRGDIPGNGDGNTLDGSGNGVLVYHCPATVNVNSFARLYAPNHVCGTADPTSVVPGANGCAAQWGGLLFSSSPAVTPVSVLPANYINSQDPGGLSWDVTGLVPNSEIFITADAQQNFVSKSVHEMQGGRNGGTFLIYHSGTLDQGTFQVSRVDFFLDVSITIPLPFGVTALGHAQNFIHYEFISNIVQSNPSQGNKNVPMMGGLGLVALFGGLLALGSRLQRRYVK